MECEEAKLKLNAMIDNEIDEGEVPATITHLESCYRCRADYIELMKLQRKAREVKVPEPPEEWFENLSRRVFRRWTGLVGRIFFIGSYVVLLGYALYTMFADAGTDLFVKVLVGGIAAGFAVLLGATFYDRVRESKTDRYKGVMK